MHEYTKREFRKLRDRRGKREWGCQRRNEPEGAMVTKRDITKHRIRKEEETAERSLIRALTS